MNGISGAIVGGLFLALIAGWGWAWNDHINTFKATRNVVIENCISLQKIESLLTKELADYNRCNK